MALPELSSILLIALAAASCGNGGDSNANPDTNDGGDQELPPIVDADLRPDANRIARVLVSWTLADGCLDGDEVETEIRSMTDGRVFVRRDPCSTSGSSLSDPLPIGAFDLLLRLVNNDIVVDPDAGPGPGPLVALSDLSGPHQSAEGVVLDVAIAFPTATAIITSSWGFAVNEVSQDCAEAGVVNVDLAYELVGGSVLRQLRVPCTDGNDISGALPTGSYLITATALDGADAPVFAPLQISVPLFVGNQDTNANLAFVPPAS